MAQRKYKYLVYAFYENLAKHKRITGYNSLTKVGDYVSGLRMCETPYLIIDNINIKLIDVQYFGMKKERLIEIFKDNEDTLWKKKN